MVLKESWSLVRGSITWKYKEEVSDKVVLKEDWSLVKGSITWKYKGEVSEKVVLKKDWSFIKDSTILAHYHLHITAANVQVTKVPSCLKMRQNMASFDWNCRSVVKGTSPQADIHSSSSIW